MNKGKSLRRKLLVRMLAASIIPILLVAAVSQVRLDKSMRRSQAQQLQTSMDKYEECMDLVLDKYETILYDLCTDDEVVEVAENMNLGEDDLDVNRSILRRKLSHICNRNDGIEGITIFLQNGEQVYYDRMISTSSTSDWMGEIAAYEWEEDASYSSECIDIRRQDGGGTPVFQVRKDLVDYRDIQKNIGKIVMCLDESLLRQALESTGESAYYLYKNQTIISAPDSSQIGRNILQIDKEGCQVIRKTNERTGWKIVNYYPMEKFQIMVYEQGAFWIVMVIGLILILGIISSYTTRPIVDSVNELMEAMNVAETGNFKIRIQENKNTALEINRIALGFNELMERIDELLEQVKTAVTEQKNAELSALEAQIDPHFLYNTLDTINWRAIEYEQYEISDMVGALADILRYTVKNAGAEASVLNEISWLKQYVLLQKVKLGRKLKLHIQMTGEVEQERIHKLLLQPFVENALKHGLYKSSRECILNIAFEKLDNQMHISIYDNGVGLPKEKLEALNKNETTEGNHLGIANVRRRLNLYYGDEAALYFESEEQEYTMVHLFIPVQEEKDENSNC